jgi:hypothetical protein
VPLLEVGGIEASFGGVLPYTSDAWIDPEETLVVMRSPSPPFFPARAMRTLDESGDISASRGNRRLLAQIVGEAEDEFGAYETTNDGGLGL